jgi:predicted enzyme related to lactoylglutathione lyase
VANQEGFSHIAFEVEDIPTLLKKIRKCGGGTVGKITSHKIEGVGYLTFVYSTDPEGNIIELQNWK